MKEHKLYKWGKYVNSFLSEIADYAGTPYNARFSPMLDRRPQGAE